jgi:Zn finger protein HypA/HybF involved in hydrogenase expression
VTRPFRYGPGNTSVLDMTGKTLRRWRVLAPAMSLGRGARWLCECLDCGTQHVARGSELRGNGVACPGCKARKGEVRA